MNPSACETTTSDRFDRTLEIEQPRTGYRVNEDSLWLARFYEANAEPMRWRRVADLGCGVGALGLWIAQRFDQTVVDGFERQPVLAALAKSNARRNGLGDRFTVHEADLREHRQAGHPLKAQTWEAAVINPPYFAAGTGLADRDDPRHAARHAMHLPLEAWIAAARHALVDGGRLAGVFPAGRLDELLAALAAGGLQPKVLQLAHPDPEREARQALFLAVKGSGPGLAVRSPLFTLQAKRSESVR